MSDDVRDQQGESLALVEIRQPTDLQAEFMRPAQDWFAGWPLTDEASRLDVLRAYRQADMRSDAGVNTEYEVVKFFCHIVHLRRDDTPELIECVRSVLFLANGKTIASYSSGVFESLKRIAQFVGMGPWDPPLILYLAQIPSAGGKRYFDLQYRGRAKSEAPGSGKGKK